MNLLWFVARASGIIAAVLLTAVIVLGVMRSERWQRRFWPRFASNHLHRSLSWLLLATVVIHVGAILLDQYAPVTVVDAIVPFLSQYRRWWTGLGTLSLDLVLLVLMTTALIRVIGQRRWRVVHWLGYAIWPAAVLHGVAAGSDAHQWWALLLLSAALVAAAAAMLWRIAGRSMGTGTIDLGVRAIGALGVIGATCAIVGFTMTGPLQAGWAAASGTPAGLGGATAPSVSTTLQPGLDEPLAGPAAAQSTAGTVLTLNGSADKTLTVEVFVPVQTPGSATVSVRSNDALLCSTAVQLRDVLAGTCGSTPFTLSLSFGGSGVVGELTTGTPT
ncbi:MAG: ferric reductase-like transmembrane domain-containing protein [Candidatus Dormibacteraeota bacterium]|nr:ferric reductase-like transmembrane domain-containing protein [Candidatus Dormibacteraeota bacterium]